jgi:hypothetical protein
LIITMAQNPIFGILWLALLIFIAWPVAGIAAAIWIFLQVRWENMLTRLALGMKLSFWKWRVYHIASVLYTHQCVSARLFYYVSHLKLAFRLSRALRSSWRSSSRGLVIAERLFRAVRLHSQLPCKCMALWTEELCEKSGAL